MIFTIPINNDALHSYYRRLVEALAMLPPMEGVALLPVDERSFLPQSSADCSAINFGVYLPGNGQITAACLNPGFNWDMIVVPSYWLEYQLKSRGVANVVTVLPGCDAPPSDISFERPRDGRFVVTSCGPLSLHQGHDLFLAAMKRFMEKHKDCWLACHWKLTRHGMNELCRSPYCSVDGCVPWDYLGFLEHNGIDSTRVVNPASLAACLWDTVAAGDVYLSPARVSLGVDAALSAFRVAGKTVIEFEPLGCTPLIAPDGTTVWFEPSIADILDRLESAYALWRDGCAARPITIWRSWNCAADEIDCIASRYHKKDFLSAATPVSAFTWNKRGAALAGLGLYDSALENYRQALSLNPLNSETYNCLGNLMDTEERHQEALLYFEKAINIDKRFVAAYFNMATTLKKLQRLDEAIDAYQKAVLLDPLFAMGWLNLAVAFALNNQLDKADECFAQTLELDPENTDALFLWGNQLMGQRALEKAINCYERILSLEPDHYLACNSMGIAYLSLMEAEKAYSVLSRALSVKPDMTSAMTNIGTACRDLERLDEAVLWYNRALALEPDDADTHWNLALALLHKGEYLQGWREYEWRFRKSDRIKIRTSELPLWRGEDPRGKTILLQAEQGYGDTIQFLRYAQLVADRGGNVIVECQDANIQSVVELFPGIGVVITWNDQQPPADYKIPLMSLPLAFETTVDSIPMPGKYLFPLDHNVAKWRSIINAHSPSGNMRVGFVWDGRKTFRNDKRSIPLEKLAPLFDLDGVTFISLQKGEQAGRINLLPDRRNILDISEQLTDFADTASLIAGLDLVICVDTSVAHLAGAVGCPTWVLLKIGPDWRWLEGRYDSPWYSSFRLYRQQRDGQWDDVVRDIRTDLSNFASIK